MESVVKRVYEKDLGCEKGKKFVNAEQLAIHEFLYFLVSTLIKVSPSESAA
ncbi:MAG: hypothetical protein NPIRA05_20610 [Nitrospirales bacterium]|nr:MAG: hypothetical protein NPIRA05_20610 [Nitrospirales bacterium]